MAEKLLGPVFEIHGGGLDLRFPHHENELAQSRGAGREFAQLWAHNGMLELAQEKMSKSLGNIVSLRDALDTYGREAILVLFLGAHYRSPVEYSDEAMEAARRQAEDFRTAFRVVEQVEGAPTWDEFAAALEDDFNTPLALSILHAWRSAGELSLLERGLGIFGLAVEPHSRRAARRSSAWPSNAGRPASAARLRAGRRAASRDRAPRVGGPGRRRRLSPDPEGLTRELVYGRQPVREVVRAGKRQILELLVTERALAAEPWLREISGLRLQIARGAEPERRCAHDRASGCRRVLRAVPLRRRARARGGREPARGLPRPGHRSAQPRRGHPQRRRRGRERRSSSPSETLPASRRPSARRRRARWSTCA